MMSILLRCSCSVTLSLALPLSRSLTPAAAASACMSRASATWQSRVKLCRMSHNTCNSQHRVSAPSVSTECSRGHNTHPSSLRHRNLRNLSMRIIRPHPWHAVSNMCVRERERQRASERARERVQERESESEGARGRMHVCVCVCPHWCARYKHRRKYR